MNASKAPSETEAKGNRSQGVVDLGRELKISQVRAVAQQLGAFLQAQEVLLDASQVELIDTAGLQLLGAFVRDAERGGVEFRWAGVSEPFLNAAQLLDLAQHLRLTGSDQQTGVSCDTAGGVDPGVTETVRSDQDREAGQEPAPARNALQTLDLAIAQIEAALREGDDNMGVLTEVFTRIASEVKAMERAVGELHPAKAVSAAKSAMNRYHHAISSNVKSAIVAFQFYDRLTQRLSHVQDSLVALVELLSDESHMHSPEAWNGLKQALRSRYSMSQERNLFDALMTGVARKEALGDLAVQSSTQDTSEVELFG